MTLKENKRALNYWAHIKEIGNYLMSSATEIDEDKECLICASLESSILGDK